MTFPINRRIVLANRPQGSPRETDFRLEETNRPSPRQGEMLCRTIYLSLDPYMRGRMNAGPSYAPSVAIDDVMVGQTVSQVVESHLEGFGEGDFVLNPGGWQEYSISDGAEVRKLDPSHAPLSTAVGVLGMPGMTAWVGLLEHGRPKAAETLVVSAASGAVGSVVGQIGKIKGLRVVGVAGAQEKCDYVTEELGFDACVSHKSPTLADDLKAACPGGIDVYFENVGGVTFDAVLPLLNDFARVPICGRIANYSAMGGEASAGPDKTVALMGRILVRRLTFRGFIVFDHADRTDDFLAEMGSWVREGKVRYREDIVVGLENCVEAFQGLLVGKNFGKLLVRVSADPTSRTNA